MADASAGVFETLLVSDGRVQALERHLHRLRASVAELYDEALPPELGADVRRRIAGLAGGHRLRIDAVPSLGEPPTVTLKTSPLDPARPRRYQCTALRLAGGQGPHKFRDRHRLTANGGLALIVDADGTVLEATWANVWLLDGDRLITPPADGRILPGVTRARLLELAPTIDLQVLEQRITLAEARDAAGIVLTSSLALAAIAAVMRDPSSGLDATVDAIRDALAGGEWS